MDALSDFHPAMTESHDNDRTCQELPSPSPAHLGGGIGLVWFSKKIVKRTVRKRAVQGMRSRMEGSEIVTYPESLHDNVAQEGSP